MSGMLEEFNVAFFAEDKFNNLDLNNMPNSFEHILHGCKRLINVNINSFDTSNATKMMFMFGNCRN